MRILSGTSNVIGDAVLRLSRPRRQNFRPVEVLKRCKRGRSRGVCAVGRLNDRAGTAIKVVGVSGAGERLVTGFGEGNVSSKGSSEAMAFVASFVAVTTAVVETGVVWV